MTTFIKPVASFPEAPREARTPFGARIVVHATAAETAGVLGSWDTFTPPGQGPAPHIHSRETETFRVITGTYRFWCAGETFVATPGTVVVLPPHVEHAWRNIGDGPGQMMAIVTPGGNEQMFLDIVESGATDADDIAVIEARYGISNADTRRLGFG